MNERESIRVAILELLNGRSSGKSTCPSEVARLVFDEDTWRERMSLVRAVAIDLAEAGIIEICQRGIAINPEHTRGPIRLRLKLN